MFFLLPYYEGKVYKDIAFSDKTAIIKPIKQYGKTDVFKLLCTIKCVLSIYRM